MENRKIRQNLKVEFVQHDSNEKWENPVKCPEDKNKNEKYVLAFLSDMQYNSKAGTVHKMLNSSESKTAKRL